MEQGSTRTRVLFVCTGNSARSQMAEALLSQDPAYEVASAGTEPKGVHALTVRVLDEAGIDWRAARSKAVTEFLGQPFDEVITVCDRARETCPYFPGPARRRHWDIDDPAAAEGDDERRLAAFRAARDELAAHIAALRAERAPAGPAATTSASGNPSTGSTPDPAP